MLPVMDGERTSPRKRCCVCRRRFVPQVAAAGHQKTCGEECRRKRRRALGRRRRARELREYRVDERERQRACRLAQQVDGGMSRTGLVTEVLDLQRVLLEIVDRNVELSRAGLRREVTRLLRVNPSKVGQAAPASP